MYTNQMTTTQTQHKSSLSTELIGDNRFTQLGPGISGLFTVELTPSEILTTLLECFGGMLLMAWATLLSVIPFPPTSASQLDRDSQKVLSLGNFFA